MRIENKSVVDDNARYSRGYGTGRTTGGMSRTGGIRTVGAGYSNVSTGSTFCMYCTGRLPVAYGSAIGTSWLQHVTYR
jgi:hypothetical protein